MGSSLSDARTKLEFRVWRSDYSFAFFILSLLNLFTPRIVPWDGYLYLSSGMSLFTSDMDTWYHWVREPGYPFLIWLSLKLGSIQVLFFIQNIALGVACVLFVRSWNTFKELRMSSGMKRVSICLMVFGMHGYANSVLQTTWYIFLTSILTYLVTHMNSQKGVFLKLMPLTAAVCSLLAVGMAFSFLSIAILLLTQKSLLSKSQILSLIVSITLCLGVSLGWVAVKNSYELTESKFQGANSAFDVLQGYTSQPLVTVLEKIIQTPFSLIGLAPERYEGSPVLAFSGEAKIFGAPSFVQTSICGRIYPGPEGFSDRVSNLLSFTCIPWGAVQAISKIGEMTGLLLFPLAGVGCLILFVWILAQSRKKWILLLPSFLVLLPYVLLGAGISRYGAPIFALGILSILSLRRFFPKMESVS